MPETRHSVKLGHNKQFELWTQSKIFNMAAIFKMADMKNWNLVQNLSPED